MNITTLGKMAFYKGKLYEFLRKDDGSYAIFSNNADDEKKGFEKIDINRFKKKVNFEDLDYVFEVKTSVIYHGDEFIGSIIEGNEIMLYTHDIRLGEKYNMIMRDRDAYYLYVKLDSVDEITYRWITIKEGVPTKHGAYAVYMGKEYRLGEEHRLGENMTRWKLLSSSEEDLEKGFELCEPFIDRITKEKVVCVKYVKLSELEDYYSLSTKVLYAGYEFYAREETEDEILIVAKLGDSSIWRSLGMICINEIIYQKWIKKSEVEIKVIKERH